MLLKRSFTGRFSLPAFLAVGLLATSPAVALGEITFAVPQSKPTSSDEKAWLVCKVAVYVTVWVTPPKLIEKSDQTQLTREFETFSRNVGDRPECRIYPTLESVPADRKAGSTYRGWEGDTITVLAFPNLPESWAQTKGAASKKPAATTKETEAPTSIAKPGPEEAQRQAAELAAAERKRAHEQVVERNRLAQEKYEAELAEQQRKVAEFERAKEDVARKKAEQQAAADAVLAQHAAEMEKHSLSLVEYQDAQRHHALCSVGDQAACDRMANGKLAEARTDAGDASTDTDARQCVTEPVLSPNEAFKGSIKAVVVNGCDKPVDVRICLMRTGGWNCGMRVGLKPQEDWTWWTGDPQDGVFWDAKTSGSKRDLGSPQG